MLPAGRSANRRWMKFKVCLVGEQAVGKTALIRRYVLGQFDERYMMTLGARVSKKSLDLQAPDGPRVSIELLVWDIMGQKGFRELLREAYFHGAQGILAVCDITRKDSLPEIHGWIENVHNTVGKIPVVLVANKADLKDKYALNQEALETFAEAYGAPLLKTSAKTGENVEAAFLMLARAVLEREAANMVQPGAEA